MKGFRQVPWATFALVVVNIAAAFMVVARPSILLEYGFKSEQPSWLNAIVSLFLHHNLFHLLGNMVFLVAVGGTVEQLSGAGRFLLVYFVSGLVGIFAHMILSSPGVPLVGASGAVAGCAGYYSLRYLNLEVPLAPKVGATVLVVSIVWLALQTIGAFVHLGEGPSQVSYWAHIGGFLSGLVFSVLLRAPDIGQIRARQTALSEAAERSVGARLAVAEKFLRERPRDVVALREFAAAQRQLGEHELEAQVLLRIVELVPETEQGAELLRLCEMRQAGRLSAIRRTMLAEKLKDSDPNAAAALLQSVVDEPDREPQRPDAILALASLKIANEPDKAKTLLQELTAKYPLHPAVELARARGWVA